jgi:hypothetical protein
MYRIRSIGNELKISFYTLLHTVKLIPGSYDVSQLALGILFLGTSLKISGVAAHPSVPILKTEIVVTSCLVGRTPSRFKTRLSDNAGAACKTVLLSIPLDDRRDLRYKVSLLGHGYCTFLI